MKTEVGKFEASAPSNIALIKYMGKKSHDRNLPSNSSISLTLPHLTTTVQLEVTTGDTDSWEALELTGQKVELSEKAISRFLDHLERLKRVFEVKEEFIVRSGNNFPKDSGLASSASSFAALTLAFSEFLKEEKNQEVSRLELAKLSREGSGSSCRSFFGPWCEWDETSGEVIPVEIPFTGLYHLGIVVSAESKAVSSSEAHKRVQTSALNQGREARANTRLAELKRAFQDTNWKKAKEITQAEFWDMMGLFHTSSPPFSYIKPGSIEILDYVDEYWSKHDDGPIVTLDAGPNIHLIFRNDQLDTANHFKAQFPQFTNHPSWSSDSEASGRMGTDGSEGKE